METSTEEAALEELKTLRALHASLVALKEMVKSVNKDYATLSGNYSKLSATNEQWGSMMMSQAAPDR